MTARNGGTRHDDRKVGRCLVVTALAIAAPAEAQRPPSVAPRNMQAIAPALADYTDEVLFGDVWRRTQLSPRDRSLVTLSVLISTGKSAQLGSHLGRGLTNGIQPAEIAGMVTHLAFYSGWPNAVSALNVIESTFAERKIGTEALRPRAGTPVPVPPSATSPSEPVDPAAPKLVQLTRDVLAADLWQRTDLTARDRSLVTIAALAANGEGEQLRLHLRRGLANGLTRQEIGEAITHLAFYAGWPKATAASQLAGTVFAERGDAPAASPMRLQIVPAGQAPVAGPATNFAGPVTVTSAFRGTDAARLGGATVTFQPGARTNWHVHPLGQLLIVTAGSGYVQVDGEAARPIRAGDTVWTAPGVKHWHGAARTAAMTHVAVAEALDGASVTWLEPVSAGQYDALR